MRRMMLDVESVGLHGEGFAFGYVIEEDLRVVEERLAIADPSMAIGQHSDWNWLEANVFPWINALKPEFPPEHAAPWTATKRRRGRTDPVGLAITYCNSPSQLREVFWSIWMDERARGTQLWADVSWPVEAGFLSACVRAEGGRKFEGPYPILDVATLWEVHVGDSLERLPSELPEHHPVMDSRHSLRKLHIVEEKVG